MAYEVTATRRRPRQFDDVMGQEFVSATLKNALKQERVAQAYLFSGPRGVGKTSSARILAKALNCTARVNDEPCGQCPSCLEIQKGNSMDVIEIDGASNTGVNDIREIKDEVLFAPSNSKYKVYIIDEVHMLSNSAFNALLKTIEEPPPYIIFIFATTEIHKVPATIRSRCQQFHFRLISSPVMRKSLEATAKELQIEAEADALSWIAKEATGSLRDAYTLFDQIAAFSGKKITLEKIRDKLGIIGLDRINELAALLVQSKTLEALDFMTALLDGGVAVEQFVIDLAEYFRSLLFIKAGITRENVLGYPCESFNENIWKKLEYEQLEVALSDLLELHRSLRYSINPRYELELCISRLSRVTDRISNTALVREMKALKNGFMETAGNGNGNNITIEPEQSISIPSELPSDDSSAEIDNTTVFDVEGFKDVFLDHIKKKKLALHAALQKAVDFRVNPDTLFLVFDSQYSASFVKQDIQLVTEAAVLALGHRVKIEVEIRDAAKNGAIREVDAHVDTILKVFRGEIIEEKK